MRDIMIEKFSLVTHKILQAASKGLTRLKFIEYITKALHNEMKSAGVELYLFEKGKAYSLGVKNDSGNDVYYAEIQIDSIKNFRLNFYEMKKWIKDFFQLIIDNDLKKYRFVFSGQGSVVKYKQKEDPVTPEEHYKYKSYMTIPFAMDDNNYGVVVFKSYDYDFFDIKSLNFFGKLATIISDTFLHQYAHDALRERVKEISCLYQVSQIANKSNILMRDIFQQIAVILPKSMQYPEIAFARISVDGETYLSNNFLESNVKLSSEIYTNNQRRGILEVFYSELMIPFHSRIFLEEEKNLITAVSEQISFIIERKQIEENNQKLQEQLRHADRLATIGQLSAGIAHEINEPLGTILGFAQLIEGSVESEEKQISKDIKKIIDASMHAREIIRKLMLFSRQMPPKKCEVNLNNLISDGLYFIENRCQKHGINIKKKLHRNIPVITADPNQIHQVLVNLCVNAIQAMQDGGELTITTGYKKEKHIFLTVEDNGVGIPQKFIDKIFIPFFTTKDINQGTGLGLSVVHGIISSHGGSIEVKTQSGSGTRFIVNLPLDGVNKGVKK